MADRIAEIMALIRNVCEEENLQVTLKGSLKNSLIAGAGTFIGCALAGPWGGVPGAMAGAALAAATGSDFKPLWQVISEWPDDTKNRLTENIRNILRRLDATDVAALGAMAAGAAPAVRAEIVAALIAFCQNDMNLAIAER